MSIGGCTQASWTPTHSRPQALPLPAPYSFQVCVTLCDIFFISTWPTGRPPPRTGARPFLSRSLPRAGRRRSATAVRRVDTGPLPWLPTGAGLQRLSLSKFQKSLDVIQINDCRQLKVRVGPFSRTTACLQDTGPAVAGNASCSPRLSEGVTALSEATKPQGLAGKFWWGFPSSLAARPLRAQGLCASKPLRTKPRLDLDGTHPRQQGH